MTEIVIKAENVGKKYLLGGKEKYLSIRDIIVNSTKVPLKLFQKKRKKNNPSFWALKNISFEIKKGEVVGIIGRNGAGKSTLLKVLSRITSPSSGKILLKGRISSLLEVGTGFHPELTGRENIYLNGAILGMTKKEINKKFENIVDFSGVRKFLDTPVKKYSSGMYVRLAFAVAAHLEPEILLVDEVLSVGDAEFQKKCLGKMSEVAKGGRTILFVSHNLSAVRKICGRTILLDKGKIVRDGPTAEVINEYMKVGSDSTCSRRWNDAKRAPGDNIVKLQAVSVIMSDGKISKKDINIDSTFGIKMEYKVLSPGHVLSPNYHFYTEEGVCAFILGDVDLHWRRKQKDKGIYTSTVWIPGNLLSEGVMTVNVALTTVSSRSTINFHELDAISFNIVDKYDGTTARGDYSGKIPGVIRPLLKWETKLIN